MERKLSTLILSGLLLASFFVPAIKWEDFTMSGFDMVVSPYIPSIKYITLAIPACALCLLTGAMVDEEKIMYNKYLLRIPFFALVAFLILLFLNTESRLAIGSANPFKMFDLGLWATLVLSIFLSTSKKKSFSLYV